MYTYIPSFLDFLPIWVTTEHELDSRFSLLCILYMASIVWASHMIVKNPPAKAGDAGDAGLAPELGRSPGGGHGNPLQCSCLENPMDGGAWWATVRRVSKSWMPASMHQLCIYVSPNLPVHPPHPSPIGIYMFVPCVCVSISALQVRSSVPSF